MLIVHGNSSACSTVLHSISHQKRLNSVLPGLPTPGCRSPQSPVNPQIPLHPHLHLLQQIPPPYPFLPPKNPLGTPNTPRPHLRRHNDIRPQPIPNNSNLLGPLDDPSVLEPLYNLLTAEGLLPCPLGKSEDGNAQRRELRLDGLNLRVVRRVASGAVGDD